MVTSDNLNSTDLKPANKGKQRRSEVFAMELNLIDFKGFYNVF